ncbi:MAG: arginyltransferase [Planctomycetota bacterium]|nr:arginyltransferase [Planctomycetota bacterium]
MNRQSSQNISSISLPLFRSEPHRCPYLPDRMAEDLFTVEAHLEPARYQYMMDLGFRRSGRVVYRPACDGCSECVPIRVPVSGFAPSRSQRRVLRRNADIHVQIGSPKSSERKWRIFVEYLRFQHDGTMSEDREGFEQFLYTSPTDTLEMVYYAGRRIAGVGLVDLGPTVMSSVYYYFDPAMARRSLGVFGSLYEIDECRRRGLLHWYMGYYVRDCSRMSYKTAFRPFEMLAPDGRWLRFENADAVPRPASNGARLN